MAIEDNPSYAIPDNVKEQSVPELVPQAHLETDNASTAFDDTISRDNIDFDFEEESVVEESSVWKDRAIRELFLNARDENEKFELELKTDEGHRPFDNVNDPYPPTDRPANREAEDIRVYCALTIAQFSESKLDLAYFRGMKPYQFEGENIQHGSGPTP
ncbi:hypothetical protein BGW42_006954 [Actinomortierella wolfii]|nr:hypothetical protein BGW42_006954 [Actinomortierella wolfii]